MRSAVLAAAILVGSAARLHGQSAPADTPVQSPAPAGAAAKDGEAAATWSVALSAYTYVVPGDSNYVQPSVTADRGWLHLEARANYEDIDTGSVWFGVNFGGGETVRWEFTPMIGGVFGDTSGVAPGYRGALAWWKVEFSSEGEYVVDAGATSSSFFYNWSELTVSPVEWLRAGLVTQRTRVYSSDREIQRGLMLGVAYKHLDVAAYVFNPDDTKPTAIVAVAVDF